MPERTLVLGLGNILLQDEGLGVRAVEQLAARYELPPDVEVLDGGTLGLDLLPRLDGVHTLLLVDAVKSGQPPGALIRLEGDAIPAALALKMSMHQLGLGDLLAVSSLRGTLPPRVILWGMEPASFDWSLDLSPSVTARLDELVQVVVQELCDLGIGVRMIVGKDERRTRNPAHHAQRSSPCTNSRSRKASST